MYYMMRTGRRIPWTMQGNCTSLSNSTILLAEEKGLRRKKIKIQKTKKNQPKSGL